MKAVCVFIGASFGRNASYIGLLNIYSYFDKLIEFIDYFIQEFFLNLESLRLLKISDNPVVLLNTIIEENMKLDDQSVIGEEYILTF